MNRGVTDFALRLLFIDWRISQVIFLGIGIGGSIVGHLGTKNWSLNHTFMLVAAMLAATIIARCISFAYKFYCMQAPKFRAIRFVNGEGLNKGDVIIVLSPGEGASKGQLITLFCESSGARQPILVAEVTSVNSEEVQAVPITTVPDQDLRKYFEEESRRRMLFATSEVTVQNLITQGFGARDG